MAHSLNLGLQQYVHFRGKASIRRHQTYSNDQICPRCPARLVVFAASEPYRSDPYRPDASGSFESGPGRVGNVSSRRETASRRPLANSETIKEAQNTAKQFLQSELVQIFNSGRVRKEKYANNFRFQDPVVRYSGIDNFSRSVAALRALFKVNFRVHGANVTGDNEITIRWTMELTPRLARLTPWSQKLVFTGQSIYKFDVLSGRITSQKDTWDAIQDNDFLSLEGVNYIVRQLANGQTTPKLDSPRYVVLKRAKEYEIRRYYPYLTAEVTMPVTSGPSSGDGFDELAGYIFGGNQRGASMEMTTPVFTTAGQSESGKMEFPIEGREGRDPEDLPVPNSPSRVTRKRQEGATVAVASFGGWPLDYQVTDAERRLRGALLLDGLEPEDGYKLARYNDPFTPPFLRRNEVLIKLEDYELETP